MSIQSQVMLPDSADIAGVIGSLKKIDSIQAVARATHLENYWIIEIKDASGSFESISIFLNYESEHDESGETTSNTLLSAGYSPSMYYILNELAKDLGGLFRKHELEPWQKPADRN